MSLENGKTGSYGTVMLTTGFLLGSSLVLIPGRVAGHDAWIAVLLGLAEGLLFAWLFAGLAGRFPGKTFVEIADMVYGRSLGKLISAAFLWYLLHLGAMVLANFTIYFSSLLMPETPKVVFSLLVTLVCASAAGKGIEVLTRCSELLTPLILLLIVSDTLLMIGNYHLKYLQPFLEAPLPRLLWAAHGAASSPFGETVAFLMVMAFLDNTRESYPALAKGLATAGLALAVITARNAAILGPTEKAFIFPSYQVITMINIADITRVEALVSAAILMMGFLKVATLLYGTALGTAQVFGLRSYRPLVLPAGILMVLLCLQAFSSTPDMLQFAEKIYPIYALPFQIGIPLVTLVVAAIRKLPQESR